MTLLVVVLLILILLSGGFGFGAHVLWWITLALIVALLVSVFTRGRPPV